MTIECSNVKLCRTCIRAIPANTVVQNSTERIGHHFSLQKTQIAKFLCGSCLRHPCLSTDIYGILSQLLGEPEQRHGEADSTNGCKDKWKNVDA